MNPPTWTFGSDPSCDVWIRFAEVASVHCRLTHHPSGFQIEDLGSSTGTTLNHDAVFQPTACSPSDRIHLAGAIKMPWPDPSVAKAVVRLGHASVNECPIPNDDAVSGQHAMLVIDANDQIVLIDCGSTNGTWLDNQRIKSAVLSANEPFRVGVTEITAEAVFSRTGHDHLIAKPLSAASTEPSPGNRADWFYAGILAATLLVAGLAALMLYSAASNASTGGATTTTKTDATDGEFLTLTMETDVLDEDEVVSPQKGPSTDTIAIPGNAVTSPVDAEQGTPMNSNHAGTSQRPSEFVSSVASDAEAGDEPSADLSISNEAARVSIAKDVGKSMHLIVIEAEGHQFDFAVAWEAKPHVLVTNAHVVASLENNQFKFSVIRIFDHWQRDVTSIGVHGAYRKQVGELKQLAEQSAAVRTEIQRASSDGASKTTVPPLVDRWRELRRREHWLTLKTDCYDVGWIHVVSASSDEIVHVPQLAKTPIQNRKRLQLHHPSIESDAAYYVTDETREVGRYDVEVEEMLITDDSSAPLSWLATFDEQPNDWKYFLFDGCPIVDLRGRVAGMYRGAVRTLAESPDDEPDAQFHFISRAAIDQVLEQADSQHPSSNPR